MKNINNTIKHSCKKGSKLDKEFNKFLKKTLKDINDDDILYRWETYNLIINELIDLGRDDLFDEIKYRFTDGEDPNIVMLEILDKVPNISGFLWLIVKKIQNYAENDFENQFY
jgi:hypothetical protein